MQQLFFRKTLLSVSISSLLAGYGANIYGQGELEERLPTKTLPLPGAADRTITQSDLDSAAAADAGNPDYPNTKALFQISGQPIPHIKLDGLDMTTPTKAADALNKIMRGGTITQAPASGSDQEIIFSHNILELSGVKNSDNSGIFNIEGFTAPPDASTTNGIYTISGESVLYHKSIAVRIGLKQLVIKDGAEVKMDTNGLGIRAQNLYIKDATLSGYEVTGRT